MEVLDERFTKYELADLKLATRLIVVKQYGGFSCRRGGYFLAAH
jgi:hypothetical protein